MRTWDSFLITANQAILLIELNCKAHRVSALSCYTKSFVGRGYHWAWYFPYISLLLQRFLDSQYVKKQGSLCFG